MDTETAIETKIKPQLLDAFGQRVTNSLLTLATLAYVITNGNERARYKAFVHSICSDERVISKWGTEVTARRREEWEALVTVV